MTVGRHVAQGLDCKLVKLSGAGQCCKQNS
jgi:hypothetical protein